MGSARVRGLLGATAGALALLLWVSTAGAAPTYRDPPGYRGITKAPATKPRVPPSIALGTGTFPDALVDEAGTAHIVWNDGRGDLDDAAMYCRLKRGAGQCDGPPVALTWNKTYGAGDGPEFNIDNFGPKLVRIGNQLVVFSKRYPTSSEKPDGASSHTVVAWTSADGGKKWTDAQIVGKWNIEALARIGPDEDPSILALGYDPFCGSVSNMCVTEYQSGQYARDAGDLAVGPDQAYDASLAIDNAGRPVAAFHDLQDNVILRRWNKTASAADPAQWTAPAPAFKGADLRLAGGPTGLFVMSKPPAGQDYEVRRLDGADPAAVPGQPVKVSDGDDPVLNELFEDPGGRLMAAWQRRGGDNPGVQLRVARPVGGPVAAASAVPSLNPAETLIDGSGNGQIRLAAWADGGGFVIANHTGGISSPGPIVATAFGNVAATGKPGLGDIPGGVGQTNSCGVVKFGAIDAATDSGGCFFLGVGGNASKYVTRGAIDLFGLKIVPDAGVKLVIDPQKLTLDAVEGNAQVRVILSSSLTGDITLWHGTFHRDLSKLVPGSELFSFDSSAFLANVLGFDVSKNISVKLNRKGDGLEIPVSLRLPAGFGGASADATLTANRASGLEIGSLHLHLGPVTIGVATLNKFDLVFEGADQLWSGEGNITFAGFGSIGAKAEFHMGKFKEAHVSFEPATPPAIGPFVYLLRADVGFGVNPFFIELGGQIGGGVAVKGEAPVKLDGTARFTVPAAGPAEFKAEGKLSAAMFKVATARLRFQTDGYADFNAQVEQDLTLLNFNAALEGFVDAHAGEWGADLKGSICLGLDVGCLGGEAAASPRGLAVCGTLFGGSAGVRVSWEKFQEISESIASTILTPVVGEVNAARIIVDNLAVPCNTSGFRVPPPRARAAQAGTGAVATVPAGLPSETIAVFGDGSSVPQVDLVGPGGARVDGPAAGAPSASSPAGRAFNVPKARAVVFVINAPRAGAWSVVPRAGSAPVTSIMQSDGYRAATATANVRGKGRARTLRYRVANRGPGQSVEFIERGSYGTRRIGAPRGAAGTLRIAPSTQPGGRRTIYAQVSRDGVVTDRTAIARYNATGPPRPGVVSRLRVKRAGRVVTVTWRRAANAARYRVRVSGKGTSQVALLGRGARRARFTSIARTVRLTVEVRAIGTRFDRGAARKVVSRGS